jgi:hypothetical protein
MSFRKRDWIFSDYPTSIRPQKLDPSFSAPRYKQHQYSASIVNWSLSGSGDTRGEAISDLNATFERVTAEKRQQGRPLPRPGARVPLEFASQERIEKHPELAKDFTRRVLGFPWAFISDGSTLWDFHTEQTNEFLYAKVMEIYGVDVSDIEPAQVSDILDRIAATRES